MAAQTTNPAPVGRHGARNDDLAGRLITSENSFTPHRLQRLRVARRFGLSLPVAAAIAELAFAARPAR